MKITLQEIINGISINDSLTKFFKKAKQEMQEARKKDLEKEINISQIDFVLKNEKAFKYLLEYYTQDFTIEEIPQFQKIIIRIGRYTLIFDKWFVRKEELFFKLQKFNFLWENKKRGGK